MVRDNLGCHSGKRPHFKPLSAVAHAYFLVELYNNFALMQERVDNSYTSPILQITNGHLRPPRSPPQGGFRFYMFIFGKNSCTRWTMVLNCPFGNLCIYL